MGMNRRDLLKKSVSGAVGLSQVSLCGALLAQGNRPKHILLRSSWQTVNIGDIAHTPGVLRILEEHLPDISVTLWPSNLDNGVDELLKRRFPKLRIAKKGTKALEQAFHDCDFLLHGSGASLVAEKDIVRWTEATKKPYGIYGITLPPKKSSSTTATSVESQRRTSQVLTGARFVFFRDSKSLAYAKRLGVESPIMEFGPDGAFGCDLRNDDLADAFLSKNDLMPGKFLCCIPRLRYTPYWKIKKHVPFNEAKHRRNEEMKEHDHKPLRQAIEAIVAKTDLKVLVCPEDRTQMEVGKELIIDRLPKAVLKRVVWRPNYWLTGEAISTYTRSAGLFGNEMHSPIMCIGHGIPAIVCRFAEQTTKGYMWEDIGLGEWLFDLDSADDVEKIVPTVLDIATNPNAAREKARTARDFVRKRQAISALRMAKELEVAGCEF